MRLTKHAINGVRTGLLTDLETCLQRDRVVNLSLTEKAECRQPWKSRLEQVQAWRIRGFKAQRQAQAGKEALKGSAEGLLGD